MFPFKYIACLLEYEMSDQSRHPNTSTDSLLGGDKLAQNHAQGWGFVLAVLKFVVPLPQWRVDGS